MRVYELRGTRYFEITDGTPSKWLEQLGLGLTLWEGKFEHREDVWLRWCDKEGNVLPTGDKLAQQAQRRAQQLAEQLRTMGLIQRHSVNMLSKHLHALPYFL